MQCRELSVWSVYFNFNTVTYLPKLFFPEGMGGVHKTPEGLGGGGGGYFCVQNMEIPGRRGGIA